MLTTHSMKDVPLEEIVAGLAGGISRGIRDGSVKKYLVWPWPGGGVRGGLSPMVANSHKNGIAYAVFTAMMAL